MLGSVSGVETLPNSLREAAFGVPRLKDVRDLVVGQTGLVMKERPNLAENGQLSVL